jgi:hypothetical protein
MLYGACVMLEPFLLLKSDSYREQIAIQRALQRKFRHTTTKTNDNSNMMVIERIHPMMPIREEKMLLTLSFMLCAAVGTAVLLLGGFHIYLVLTAQTTIEFHGNFANRKRSSAAGQKWQNPYSLRSWRQNWQQVYGKGTATNIWTILLSLLPSRRERDYLPAPVPGNPIRLSCLSEQQMKDGDNVDNDGNDEKSRLISHIELIENDGNIQQPMDDRQV